MQKNQFLKVKNSVLELEKDFIELKDIKLKDRDVKIKRQIEELFFKLITVSIGLRKEMKKIRSVKSTCCDWLINYIPQSIRKSVGGLKDKIVVLLRQTHRNKLCMGEEGN